ncbi:MAG: NAD(P)/FAD-dependent oxidoreductase [Firmicutes bacterium]|nr:NAD(P)/FAD-dependent oxidoreductase [Bacillota bacterium]
MATVTRVREIAVVGGGPSGAICAERLARAGWQVTVLDERLAWEKPCGGGLTYKAIERYPFLLDGPEPKKLIRDVVLMASSGQRVRFTLDRPIVIYSRRVLNGLLLERARCAGAQLVQARVCQVDTSGPRVVLRMAREGHAAGSRTADFVVLATGARNTLLPETTPLQPTDLEQTLGYYIPVVSDTLVVKFLPRFEGYLWSFPRPDHLSVGICGKLTQTTTAVMKRHLHDFLEEQGLPRQGQFYSHVLPSPVARTLRTRRVVGRNWALVGDAAAWVDPLTGEGLHYAMRSGELLAEALLAGAPESYPQRVRAEFSADLEFATRIARRFYRGRFLGGAVTVRMIQFLQRSPAFRQLMRDLFAGTQNYRSLKRRLWAQLGITFAEIAVSLFRPPGEAAEVRAE